MGREWYWVGRSSKRGGGGGGEERDISSSSSTSLGCMRAVFHWFDFHHQFQFAVHNHQHPQEEQEQPSFKFAAASLPEKHPIPKGTEAPRNSLELEQPQLASNSNQKEERISLDIPMGIQIKTSGNTLCKHEAVCYSCDSCSSSSVATTGTTEVRTPTLVARLMGLDLLPGSSSSSPRVSSTLETPTSRGKNHLLHRGRHGKSLSNGHKISCLGNYGEVVNAGTRSLPETPRMSLARRSVDVDHRLSLQINKENSNSGEEVDFSRFAISRRQEFKNNEDENWSPSYYARQIVKQVKESVGRRVGVDITNTVRSREQRRDIALIDHAKYKRSSSRTCSKSVLEDSGPGKLEFSLRLRMLEMRDKNIRPPPAPKDQISPGNHDDPHLELAAKVIAKPKAQTLEARQENRQRKLSTEKCKRAAIEPFKKPGKTLSKAIRNKQEEPFVHSSPPENKSKKTPFPNGIIRSVAVPSVLPVKKGPSPPATKIPSKQMHDGHKSKQSSQLAAGGTSQQAAPHVVVNAGELEDDRSNRVASAATTTSTGAVSAELQYATLVLKYSGIERDASSSWSFVKWFSRSHPLDPSIFYHIDELLFSDASTVDGCGGITAASSPEVISMKQHLHHKCNRKLLFDLVDEILVELGPNPIQSQIVRSNYRDKFNGSQLIIDALCTKIRSFPRADCRVLEDIDALIDEDLARPKQQIGREFEGEAGGLVAEIERDIMDTLVQETAMSVAVALEQHVECVEPYGTGHSVRKMMRRRTQKAYGSFT